MPKPLPFARRRSLLYAGKFYLSDADRDELIGRIESDEYRAEEDAVRFIDERGEWHA